MGSTEKNKNLKNLQSFLSRFTEHAGGKVLDINLLHECYLSHNEQEEKGFSYTKGHFTHKINSLGYKMERLNKVNRTWIMDLRLSREGYYKFRNLVDPNGREEVFYNSESECNDLDSKELCKVMSCEPLQKYLKDLIKEHDLGDYQKDMLNTAILIEKKLNKKNLFRLIGVKACAVLYLVTPLTQEESARITGVSVVAMRYLLRELKIKPLKTTKLYNLRELGGLDDVIKDGGLSEAFIRTIEELKRFERLSKVPKGRKPRGFYFGLEGLSNAVLQVLEFKKTKGVLPKVNDLSLRSTLYSGYWKEHGIEKWEDLLLLSNIMDSLGQDTRNKRGN